MLHEKNVFQHFSVDFKIFALLLYLSTHLSLNKYNLSSCEVTENIRGKSQIKIDEESKKKVFFSFFLIRCIDTGGIFKLQA